MYWLALDTATEHALIALFSDDALIAMKELDFGFTHSKALLPALEELFAATGISPKELQRVAVGKGPGSYTGIRVGVACAKGLSFGLNIPLIGVSSLRLFCPPNNVKGRFISIIDAKIGGFYAVLGEVKDQKILFTGKEELISVEQAVGELKKVDFLVTPFWNQIRLRFEEKGITSFPEIIECYPSTTQIFEEAKQQYALGNYSLDGTLSLLYLRKTQAEIDLLAK